MKKFFMLTLAVYGMTATSIYSQVGMPGNNPNQNAVLDLNRTDGTSAKGLLLPKVALAALNSFAPMTANVAGMHVWNTATAGAGVNAVTPGEYYNDGAKWVRVSSSADAWIQDGNNNGTLKAIGTNDAFDLPIETNNIERMRVTSGGKIGIGTTTPSNNLEISGTNGTATGLKLPTGASSGKVLTSDPNGNAFWQSSAIQLQTVVSGFGGQNKFYQSAMGNWSLITLFSNVSADDAKTIYGAAYGWNMAAQEYVVPRDGKYRVTCNIYISVEGTTVPEGENWRVAPILNNDNSHANPLMPAMPFISFATKNADQSWNMSGIAVLKAGDKINFKIANFSSGNPVNIYSQFGHTFFIIESL